MKKLSLFLAVVALLLGVSFSAMSQEKLSFTWKVGSDSQKNIGFTAAKDKQYTVDWGDSTILTYKGTGDLEPVRPMGHNYGYGSTNKYYTVTITGIEDCVLLGIGAQRTEISGLDVSGCPLLPYICCYDNHIPLSDLYAISELISDSTNKVLGTQTLAIRIKNVGDTIDFSTQAGFGGTATRFVVEKDDSAASPSDYTIIDGIIIFTNTGCYKIIMTNDAIVSFGLNPAQVIAEFCISDSNADASLLNLTVSEEELSPAFSPNVYEYVLCLETAVRSIYITATANNPNATVSGDGQQQLSTGTNLIIITVTAEDGITTQEYKITVINGCEVGIEQFQVTSSKFQVYPNPTTGQLRITNYELREDAVIAIYDVVGRNVGVGLKPTPTPTENEIVIDISHLAKGMYYLKVGEKTVRFVKE